MNKRCLLPGLAAAIFTSAVGVSPSNGADRPIVLGFAQIGSESAWRAANSQSIKDAARQAGVNLVFSDAQRKQENQIKALRSFVAQKVDVIAFSPVAESGWEPILTEIKHAGIPVILSDRVLNLSDPTLYTASVGSDFLEEGRKAGNWLADKTGGKATVVELAGTPGVGPTLARAQGFREAIASHPEMKIVRTQSGDFTRSKGKEVMESFLRAPDAKNITALFAHNDDMALGAMQAMEEAGLQPGKDIIIVSVDGIKDALEAIKAGKLNCSVESNPFIGDQIMDLARKIASHQDVPRLTNSKEGLFDSSNAAAALPSRKY